MSVKASGTFDVTGWDEQAKDTRPDGTVITRVRVTKTFHGDLAGTSVTEIQTVTTAAGPTAYVGVECFEGTLHGRKGTFVLQHSAGNDAAGKEWLRWQIVSTSGTGELAGLHGEGQITVDGDGRHFYALDYELP